LADDACLDLSCSLFYAFAGLVTAVKRLKVKVTCRVTTCLENLEMSGNVTAVREVSGKKSCQGKVA